MAGKCFGIYLKTAMNEHFMADLSHFNYFARSKISDFMRASLKEIDARTDTDSIIDLELGTKYRVYLVGVKINHVTSLIFTLEPPSHQHLISLARIIILAGPKETIEENFEYISSEMKIKAILDEIEELKLVMINNIDLLLKRGEKLDDLVERSQYLSDKSKEFYKRSKKMNKCCYIF